MSSLRRKPNSKYFIACFTDKSGQQRQVSTKETNRTKAQLIALKFESAYRACLTEAQARKVISDIFEAINDEKLFHATPRTHFLSWLKSKQLELSPGSFSRYENAVEKFLTHLGNRADRDISHVAKREIVEFRDTIAHELTASTANTDLKILRIGFRQAVGDGLRLDDPTAGIKPLKVRRCKDDPCRRPFTNDELRKLFAVISGEWLGMILFGLYTGQRLGDIACLLWGEVRNSTLSLAGTQKTDRTVIVPLATPVVAYLATLTPGNLHDPVFPNASQKKKDSKGQSRQLSNAFHKLLVKAGLAMKRSKRNTGNGHSTKRKTNELSFHSLRHTATSFLKRAGVPEAVVMDIIGHESDLISNLYTHIDEKTKQQAVAKLTEVFTP